MRVMYVEDNARDADLFRRFMRETFPSIEVDWVSRPQDAHSIGDCDVVLLDLNLDQTNYGIGTIKRFREAYPSIPIVVFTGLKASSEFVQRALDEGANAFFVKELNVDMSKIVEAMRDAMQDFVRRIPEGDKAEKARAVVEAVSSAYHEASELLSVYRRDKE